MSGLGDTIRNAINKATNATPIAKAMGGGSTPGTTSGIDAAMQQHANKVHPVPGAGNGITRRPDGSLKFPLDD